MTCDLSFAAGLCDRCLTRRSTICDQLLGRSCFKITCARLRCGRSLGSMEGDDRAFWARHTAVPAQDSEELLKLFELHHELLRDLGPYERLAKAQAPCGESLCLMSAFIKALLTEVPSARLQEQSVRRALGKLLLKMPRLNATLHNNSVWVNLKVSRLTTICTSSQANQRAEVSAMCEEALGSTSRAFAGPCEND